MTKQSDNAFPLSVQQRRLWKLQSAENPYVTTCRMSLGSSVDRSRLEAAVEAVFARHQAFNMHFAKDAMIKTPTQALREETPRIFMLDSGSGPAEDRCSLSLGQPALGQPVRVSLRQEGTSSWVLELRALTLACDARSLEIALQQIAAVYGGASLVENVTQHLDYAEWQQEFMARGKLNVELDDDPLAPKSRQIGRGSPQHVSSNLSAASYTDLRARANALGNSIEAILASAWSVVLQRSFDRHEVAVHTAHAGRPMAELAQSIGPFKWWSAEALPTDGSEPFTGLVRRTDERLTQLRRLDMPGTETQPALQSSGAMPLNVGFEYCESPEPHAKHDPGFVIEAASETFEPFDLALRLRLGGDGLKICLTWHDTTGLTVTPQFLVARFTTAIRSVLEQHDADTGDLQIISGEEQGWQRSMLSGPPIEDHAVKPLHHVFEEQAARWPHRTAVVFEEQRYSYAEANAKANRVAHELIALGAGPGVPVVVFVDRSADMIIATLAVLKSGAAYVPIETRFPGQRVAATIQSSGATIAVTQSSQEQRLRRRLPDTAETLHIDDDWAARAPDRAMNPSVSVAPDDPAYIIYTSGTTGIPKGVVIEHANIHHYLRGITRATAHIEATSFTTVSTIAADLGNTMIFCAFARGGCLHVLSWDRLLNAKLFADYMSDNSIDVLKIVPSHLAAVLREKNEEQVFPRKLLMLGGEAFKSEQARRLRELRPDCIVMNHYGPSETTVGIICGEIDLGRTDDEPPLGRPLAGVEIYLLDSARQPVPAGLVGEILVGGPTLSRGYLNQPDLTARAFVKGLPELGVSGRLYRTGDLARLRPDGQIEYVARTDRQIQVRGYRVEPDDVAYAMRQVPYVLNAAVVPYPLHDDSADADYSLVAYFALETPYLNQAMTKCSDRHVENWRTVFSQTHKDRMRKADQLDHTLGWISSYTGAQMELAEIQEQIEAITARVRAWSPQDILEIGCGTGQLLFELAGDCRSYTATEPSRDVFEYTRAEIDARPDLGKKVRLYCREGRDFADLPQDAFDLVIINSVAQYFPDIGYLEEVLEKSLRALRPNGKIFIGDVRDLRLQETFHSSVQTFVAQATATAGTLRMAIGRKLASDKELLIDPLYFRRYGKGHALISDALVEMKRGRCDTELTKFRYDVVLTRGEAATAQSRPRATAWSDIGDLETLDAVLGQEQSRSLVVTGLPNQRLDFERALAERLKTTPNEVPIKILRTESTAQADQRKGLHPEDLYALAAKHGLVCHVMPNTEAPDQIDALFLDEETGVDPSDCLDKPDSGVANRALYSFPILSLVADEVVPELRREVKERVPYYMLPDRFVLLPSLPLNLNGKVAYDQLPDPQLAADHQTLAYVEPRDETERSVSQIWGDVLGIERVGIADSFLALGGHSLSAAQIIARLQKELELEVPLQVFFDKSPTIEHLMNVACKGSK